MMNTPVPQLLLEINSPDIWHWPFFLEMARVARKYHFQGIVINQQSLLAQLASPSPRCRPADIINLSLARDHALRHLQKIGEYCERHHLQLWLQGEATPDSPSLKMKFPEFFLADNDLSAFIAWFFFESIPQILAVLPTVRGLRLSLATPDIADVDWQASLMALYRGVRAAGRQLVLRDYRDTTWPRHMLRDALGGLPGDVRASLKATELDYRPGFAGNPNLLNLPTNHKWLELDLWGLDYGWSLLPCYLLEEFRQRLLWLSQYPGCYPEAITVRIDWEWLPGLPLSASVNALNLYGLSGVVQDLSLSPEHMVHQWLQHQAASPLPGAELGALSDILTTSYEWSCKTPNLLGRVLQCRSQLPLNLEHALSLLHMDTRNANWAQSFQPLLPGDDTALGLQQCELISLENERITFLAERMHSRALRLLPGCGLQEPARACITGSMARAQKYSQLYTVFKHALMLKLRLRKYGQNQPDIQALFRRALGDFRQCNQSLETWFQHHGAEHPLAFASLLNTQQIAGLIYSLEHD